MLRRATVSYGLPGALAAMLIVRASGARAFDLQWLSTAVPARAGVNCGADDEPLERFVQFLE